MTAPKDSGAPSSEPNRPPSANSVTMASAAFRSSAVPRTSDAATTIAASEQLERNSAPPRREVLNAMRALREMPPFAREREIEHGRYSHFSPEEREMLRNVEH